MVEVQCNLCTDRYPETHMESHLVGVHGVDGPKEMYTPSGNIKLENLQLDIKFLFSLQFQEQRQLLELFKLLKMEASNIVVFRKFLIHENRASDNKK